MFAYAASWLSTVSLMFISTWELLPFCFFTLMHWLLALNQSPLQFIWLPVLFANCTLTCLASAALELLMLLLLCYCSAMNADFEQVVVVVWTLICSNVAAHGALLLRYMLKDTRREKALSNETPIHIKYYEYGQLACWCIKSALCKWFWTSLLAKLRSLW